MSNITNLSSSNQIEKKENIKITIIFIDEKELSVEISLFQYFNNYKYIVENSENQVKSYFHLSTQKLHLDISSETFFYIINYIKHKNFTKIMKIIRPFDKKGLNEILNDPFDIEFTSLFDVNMLIEMISSCDILGFEYLLEICIVRLSFLFIHMPYDDLKFYFDIDELNEESKKSILDNNQWLMKMNEYRCDEFN